MSGLIGRRDAVQPVEYPTDYRPTYTTRPVEDYATGQMVIPSDPTTFPYPTWRIDNDGPRIRWSWEDEANLARADMRAQGEAMAREDATIDPDHWWRHV